MCCSCIACNLSYLVTCGGIFKILEIVIGVVCLNMGISTWKSCVRTYDDFYFAGYEFEIGYLLIVSFFTVITILLLLFSVICDCCLIKTAVCIVAKVYFAIGSIILTSTVIASLYSLYYIASENDEAYPQKDILLTKLGLTFGLAVLYFISIFV